MIHDSLSTHPPLTSLLFVDLQASVLLALSFGAGRGSIEGLGLGFRGAASRPDSAGRLRRLRRPIAAACTLFPVLSDTADGAVRAETPGFPAPDSPAAQRNQGSILLFGIPASHSLDLPRSISFVCIFSPQGMKTSTAEYWLLKDISNLDTFGQEMFHSKFGYNGVSMIGVGPHGITVYRSDDEETQK